MNNITAVILAGGKSTRMKQDKALVKINDISLLDHQIALLSPIFENILISSNIEYSNEINFIKDIYKDKGPIGGIYSILQNIKADKAFVIAVDMPFVSQEIIYTLIENNKNFDITIPIINNEIEPTCAIYSKNCIKTIEKQIKNNNNRLSDFIKNCKTNYTEFNTGFLKNFINLNTPNDIKNL